MEEITDLSRIKRMLVETLATFAKFCDEHGLRYYLMGGTLLGAVRHKGYIPWDDDIDVGMPRPDYMRFIEMTRGGLGARYAVRSPYDGTEYTFTFVKICDARTYAVGRQKVVNEDIGVALDVFPIDGLPAKDKAIRRHFSKMKILRRFSDYARFSLTWSDVRRHLKFWNFGPQHIPYWISCLVIGKVRGYRYWIRRIDGEARKYDFAASEQVGVSVWGYGKREAMNRERFEPRVELTFEGAAYYASADHATYLRSLYGENYMQLPPEEARVSEHEYRFFMRDGK